jgi:predicted transposase YdaD
MRVYVTNMSEARREGIEEGMQDGIRKGKEEGRVQLIDDTISILDDLESRTLTIEQIAEKHNVDLRFVERLSKSIDKG